MKNKCRNTPDKVSNGTFFVQIPTTCLFFFAGLISYTARGFASGLTRSLTFAAAAIFNTLSKVFSFESFNSFHHRHSFQGFHLRLQYTVYNFPCILSIYVDKVEIFSRQN